jgi:hypothetical protein
MSPEESGVLLWLVAAEANVSLDDTSIEDDAIACSVAGIVITVPSAITWVDDVTDGCPMHRAWIRGANPRIRAASTRARIPPCMRHLVMVQE